MSSVLTPKSSRWLQLSFRSKLVLGGIAVQIVAMAVITWHSAYLIDTYFRAELVARAERQSPLFNAALAAPMLQRDYATVQAILNESRTKDLVSYLIVYDTQGRVVGQTGWLENSTKPDMSLPQPVTLVDGGSRFDFKTPLQLEGVALGTLYFGLPGTFIETTRNEMLLQMVVVSAVAVILFSLLLGLIAYFLTRPLKQLTRASQQMRSGDYDVQLSTGGGDEISVLTDDFRHMAAEVKRKVSTLIESEALQRDYATALEQEHAALERARAVAESANRAKSDFLANMSHEIRTPMHGILGTIELIGEDTLSEQQRERIDIVHRSGASLLLMLNNVLDFSRFQAGKFELDIVTFNLAKVAQDSANLFAAIASAKGVKIATEISPALAPELNGDPIRIRQILVNLLGNAVKFSESGTVTIRFKALESTGLLIEVQDQGIGIAPEALTRIFEPFAQADNSTSRKYGGTGLGLAISGQIVKLMNGELSVESSGTNGSTFRVRLPLVTPAVAIASPAEIDDAKSIAAANLKVQGADSVSFIQQRCLARGVRILLAEDNYINQFLAKAMLVKIGCQVEVAVNGIKAVELFKTGQFDVVLMDCHMPEMSGYEAAAAIRTAEAISGAARTPIIAITANVQNGERERCISVGMDDYLAKPFNQAEIATIIAKWLEAAPAKNNLSPREDANSKTLHSNDALKHPAESLRSKVPIVAANVVSASVLAVADRQTGVLIIDDDAIQRALVSAMLKRIGVTQLFTAADGAAALDCMHMNGAVIGLVICDLQMPGMDGMALLRRIVEAGHKPTVIISSGSDAVITRSVELMVAALGLAVLGSLPKPVSATVLNALYSSYRAAAIENMTAQHVSVLPSDLLRALANAEFEPFFQPKVRMSDGALAGVEVLVRWIHPTHGVLRPSEFLPFVEQQGHLGEMTTQLIARSIDLGGKWRVAGHKLKLNINLSLSALENPLFCEEVQTILAAHGLAPHDITFEILETAAMVDVGRTLEIMTRLRLNGFGLAIDDFGIGFSSFEQLSSIPFTELKIDRSFVNGVAQSARLAAMVRSCIELAQRLNLKVVAEGVELREDWDFLLAAGANEAQGYLIAKPMPAAQFLQWMENWPQQGLDRALEPRDITA